MLLEDLLLPGVHLGEGGPLPAVLLLAVDLPLLLLLFLSVTAAFTITGPSVQQSIERQKPMSSYWGGHSSRTTKNNRTRPRRTSKFHSFYKSIQADTRTKM